MLLSHEEFFLHTVEDLRNKVKEYSPYSILRACGICRQLVVDKNWLLREVNKITGTKISFLILDYDRNVFNINLNLSWITVDPFFGKSKEVDRKEFLETTILGLKKHKYNVEDIIKVASNKMGGVHSDNLHSKDKKHIAFYDFDKAAELDHSATMTALKAICKVVLNTSEKLEAIIKERTPAGGI
ncbi:MAG TPA: hypothetical protein VGQ04_03875 [Chitinophagaceae bacterium]|nr:hypothetical protein [Chitinophagaceae bacterium]